uniref:Uncharacterized protein n=1 Tax=Aegilops tauschii subsp. strangulata TaxID=200361 RepID=A0A453KZF1_AEGTS
VWSSSAHALAAVCRRAQDEEGEEGQVAAGGGDGGLLRCGGGRRRAALRCQVSTAHMHESGNSFLLSSWGKAAVDLYGSS